MFFKIIEIFSFPVMLLNMGGGIIGGIWLLILGEWRLLLIGIILIIISKWVLSILMMVGMPLTGIALYFYNRKNVLGHVFGFLTQLYTNILIIGTCFVAFFLCSKFYKGSEISITYIPYLLWSWGMSLGPWQFFASKEPNNEFTAITLFSASIFYFLFLLSIFIHPYLILIIFLLWCVVQLIVLPIINMRLAHIMTEYQNQNNVIS
ncbi:MAG: hypothetical protein AB2L13_21155 [Spirochaetota bacterium]